MREEPSDFDKDAVKKCVEFDNKHGWHPA